jgi:CRP/FNR family transcriptional regulator, cyclic AMP receptor protein
VEQRTPTSVEVVRRIPLFAGLPPADLEAIASVAEEVHVPAGETLLSEATPGREVILLVEGGATVAKDGAAVGSVGPGELIGEIGVLTRMSRIATVTTTAPSHLLVIEADAFRSLIERIPALEKGAWDATASRLEP